MEGSDVKMMLLQVTVFLEFACSGIKETFNCLERNIYFASLIKEQHGPSS